MATSKAQRIGIWIIAIFLAIGSIGTFAIIILANANSKSDQDRFNELYSQYQKDTQAYQNKLSQKYYPVFNTYTSRPAPFDAAAVTELKTEDLVIGTGADITSDSTFYAYYLGWNPQGKVFEGGSSLNETNDGLSQPLTVTPGGVIEGWTKGVNGMKEGGIRELTIPSSLAYKDQDKGADIPPNTPLKFIVITIPASEVESAPKPSAELNNLYKRLYGN